MFSVVVDFLKTVRDERSNEEKWLKMIDITYICEGMRINKIWLGSLDLYLHIYYFQLNVKDKQIIQIFHFTVTVQKFVFDS